MSAILNIRDIHKNFGDTEVLKGVDLDVDRGEVVAIIGSSGSGKTTLLRCINLLEEFHQGEVTLDGEPIGYRVRKGRRVHVRGSVLARQRTMMGMAFQSFNLFPHMSAIDNVALSLTKVFNYDKSKANDIATKWLEKVGMLERKNHWPSELSGGQQQRVAIARAIAMNPKVMLFDEVTSALDPELVGEVLNTIKSLADMGMTMILVTHEMRFANEVADRVVFMNGGEIEEQGAPHEIFYAAQSQRLRDFLGQISF